MNLIKIGLFEPFFRHSKRSEGWFASTASHGNIASEPSLTRICNGGLFPPPGSVFDELPCAKPTVRTKIRQVNLTIVTQSLRLVINAIFQKIFPGFVIVIVANNRFDHGLN